MITCPVPARILTPCSYKTWRSYHSFATCQEFQVQNSRDRLSKTDTICCGYVRKFDIIRPCGGGTWLGFDIAEYVFVKFRRHGICDKFINFVDWILLVTWIKSLLWWTARKMFWWILVREITKGLFETSMSYNDFKFQHPFDRLLGTLATDAYSKIYSYVKIKRIMSRLPGFVTSYPKYSWLIPGIYLCNVLQAEEINALVPMSVANEHARRWCLARPYRVNRKITVGHQFFGTS